jgi:hypothetical protein
MLFDSQLKVPETDSAIHMKDRERAKLDNPFNACKLKEQEEKPRDKKELVWAPRSPSYEVCVTASKREVLPPWCSQLPPLSPCLR